MAGLPLTLKLELDDAANSGTWPTDVTSRLDLRQGVEVQRGRTTAFEDINPSQLTCRLKNNDGALSRGGSLGTVRDQRVRLSAIFGGITYRRFTGYARGWPNAWEGGPAKKSFVDLVALDQLSRLNRQTLANGVQQEFLRQKPAWYFPLNEPAGSTQATNLAPSNQPPAVPLNAYRFPQVAPTFGNVGGGFVADPAVTFASSQRLACIGSPWASAPPGMTLVCAFATTQTPAAGTAAPILNLAHNPGTLDARLLWLSGAGTLIVGARSYATPVCASSAAVNNGAWHFAAIRISAGATALWLDGAVVATAASGAVIPAPDIFEMGGIFSDDPQFAGSIAHAALYPTALTDAQLYDMNAAFTAGNADDSSDARVIRLASYAGIAATDVAAEMGAVRTVPGQGLSGANPQAAMQAVAKAEGGPLFVRGDGKLVMQNRFHRAMRTSPQVTLGGGDLDPDVVILDDPDQTQNYVTGSRATTPGVSDTRTLVSQDVTSIGLHGQYPNSDLTDLLVSTDAQVQDAIDWRRTNYAEPLPRLPSLLVDALTTDTTGLRVALLEMEISDRIRLPTMPTQATAVSDLVVEGWVEKYQLGPQQQSEWSYDINASGWEAERMWVLGDTTYSVLGSTTKLGY